MFGARDVAAHQARPVGSANLGATLPLALGPRPPATPSRLGIDAARRVDIQSTRAFRGTGNGHVDKKRAWSGPGTAELLRLSMLTLPSRVRLVKTIVREGRVDPLDIACPDDPRVVR